MRLASRASSYKVRLRGAAASDVIDTDLAGTVNGINEEGNPHKCPIIVVDHMPCAGK